MKLRYYLRGLGIGMLITALVLILSGNTGGKMSDEEVKRRAAVLGMVEKDTSVLGEALDETEEEKKNEGNKNEGNDMPRNMTEEPDFGNEAGAQEPAEGTETETGGQPSAAVVPENTQTEPEGALEETPKSETEERAEEVMQQGTEAAENAPSGDTVPFVVRSGDSSYSVAQRAKEAGLVESMEEFDRFLCQNGYDKRISVGSYTIPAGATEKEIADIITRS